ncbi:MAG: monovalent cation/H(+) antiporter subunit G [Lachnospiraceae bacterium]
MTALLGKIIIIIALLFMVLGVAGLFRFKGFYHRILITSKVEVLGFITIMIGIMMNSGFNFFTGKVFLIMMVMIITNPLATHAIARSAYRSGHKLRKGE